MSDSGFEVAFHKSGAGVLHGLDLPEPWRRTVWVMTVDRPALVLGSSQSPELIDTAACASAGVEVVRRRSGGGMVLLEPRAQAWVDVLIPVTDPLWSDDVTAAFEPITRAWQKALVSLGVESVAHTGRLENGLWGDLVCFAGRGPGELLVDGAKVVGMSQRRTRRGARFQTMALSRWNPASLLRFLVPADDRSAERERLAEDLAVAGVGSGLEASVLAGAFVAELTRLD